MDNNTVVSEVRYRVGEFAGFRDLKKIDETNTSADRLQWIWEKVNECAYAFDDFTRGKVEFFLYKFQDQNVEFFEVGDDGLAVVENIHERGGADVHYLIWSKDLSNVKQRKYAAELFDYLFFKRSVHHIIGMIPSFNQSAIRFALSVGMRYEGEIRENFLYQNKYYNTQIYGLLEVEYNKRRERL